MTYEETDVKNRKRREILNLGFNTLLHLLGSEKCERLAVVGNSLGSAIAMDSLLELRRHKLAELQQGGVQSLSFEKFTDFITLGSPIDRIHYFFESYRVNKGKRYGSVVEEVRGDLGTKPFAGQAPVHWVNVHDRSDIISSALHTPNATPKDKILAVENFKTGSYLSPLLPVAHASYFQSRIALKFIFEAVFGDRPVTGGRSLMRWKGDERDVDAVREGWRTELIAVSALLTIAGLRLLFSAKPYHRKSPSNSPVEEQPTRDVPKANMWSMRVSEVMTYVGIAWIWLLAFLLTFILCSVQSLITPLLVLLLFATVLLLISFVASVILGNLESVYRKT